MRHLESWQVTDKPRAETGADVVGCRSPGGAAFAVSIDAERQLVSAEQASAQMEANGQPLSGDEGVAPWKAGGMLAWRPLCSRQPPSHREPPRTLQAVFAHPSAIHFPTGTTPASRFSARGVAPDPMVERSRVAS